MKKPLLLLLALGAGASLMAAPAAARFQAGAATSNITPFLGSPRVGASSPFPTVYVHDELHARCLVLNDGKTTIAMVVCDLLGLRRSVSLEARRLIQEATGIPPENVMISATHTHSATSALGRGGYTNDQELDEYQQFVARRIADGVRRAQNLLRPAELAFGKVDAGENLINRRWHLREGKWRTNYFGKLDRVWKTTSKGIDFTEPAGPVDPYVYFIALREPDGTPISVYSAYSAHYAGDSGRTHISADYFGMYCEKLKRLLTKSDQHPPFVGIMANATSGDVAVDPANFRHVDQSKPYQKSNALAEDLAARVKNALVSVKWRGHADLDARYREVDIAWRPIEPELLEWAKDVEAKAPRLPEGNTSVSGRWVTTQEFRTPLRYARRVQSLAKATGPAKIPLQVVRIGDICIGTTPCETYTEIGLEFQRRSPFPNSFMVEINHGFIGYLPTPRHFELGGYSTWPGTNRLEPRASEKMLDHLAEMANELKN